MKTFLFHASLLLSLLQCVTVHALASSGATSAPKTAKPLFFSSHSQRHPPNTVTLTYLEINSWLLSANGVTILVDPLLEGPLDFGIPSLYQGKKRVIPPSGLTDALPPIDGILITQGLDDHAHVRTLQKIHSLDPTVPILAPPSAKGALKAAGFLSTDSSAQVQFLHHGDEAVIRSRSSKDNTSTLGVVATKGARVGPPWQRRENGYILRSESSTQSTTGKSSGPSIYIEPHVEFKERELSRFAPVDVVISPISGQGLPAFELVHGPSDTIRLLETLRPKYLVPMQNGDIDIEGPVGSLVSEVGSPDEFQQRLAKSKLNDNMELVDVKPGEDIVLSF